MLKYILILLFLIPISFSPNGALVDFILEDKEYNNAISGNELGFILDGPLGNEDEDEDVQLKISGIVVIPYNTDYTAPAGAEYGGHFHVDSSSFPVFNSDGLKSITLSLDGKSITKTILINQGNDVEFSNFKFEPTDEVGYKDPIYYFNGGDIVRFNVEYDSSFQALTQNNVQIYNSDGSATTITPTVSTTLTLDGQKYNIEFPVDNSINTEGFEVRINGLTNTVFTNLYGASEFDFENPEQPTFEINDIRYDDFQDFTGQTIGVNTLIRPKITTPSIAGDYRYFYTTDGSTPLFNSIQTLSPTIYTTNDGGTITLTNTVFTLEPSTDTSLYSSPFRLSNSVNLKAIGVDNAVNTSAVQTAQFNVDSEKPTININDITFNSSGVIEGNTHYVTGVPNFNPSRLIPDTITFQFPSSESITLLPNDVELLANEGRNNIFDATRSTAVVTSSDDGTNHEIEFTISNDIDTNRVILRLNEFTNLLGNTGAVETTYIDEIIIDNTPPQAPTFYEGNTIGSGELLNNTGINTGPNFNRPINLYVKSTGNFTDANFDSLKYTVRGANQQVTTAMNTAIPYDHFISGNNEILGYQIDKLGRESPPQRLRVIYDNTSPVFNGIGQFDSINSYGFEPITNKYYFKANDKLVFDIPFDERVSLDLNDVKLLQQGGDNAGNVINIITSSINPATGRSDNFKVDITIPQGANSDDNVKFRINEFRDMYANVGSAGATDIGNTDIIIDTIAPQPPVFMRSGSILTSSPMNPIYLKEGESLDVIINNEDLDTNFLDLELDFNNRAHFEMHPADTTSAVITFNDFIANKIDNVVLGYQTDRAGNISPEVALHVNTDIARPMLDISGDPGNIQKENLIGDDRDNYVIAGDVIIIDIYTDEDINPQMSHIKYRYGSNTTERIELSSCDDASSTNYMCEHTVPANTSGAFEIVEFVLHDPPGNSSIIRSDTSGYEEFQDIFNPGITASIDDTPPIVNINNIEFDGTASSGFKIDESNRWFNDGDSIVFNVPSNERLFIDSSNIDFIQQSGTSSGSVITVSSVINVNPSVISGDGNYNNSIGLTVPGNLNIDAIKFRINEISDPIGNTIAVETNTYNNIKIDTLNPDITLTTSAVNPKQGGGIYTYTVDVVELNLRQDGLRVNTPTNVVSTQQYDPSEKEFEVDLRIGRDATTGSRTITNIVSDLAGNVNSDSSLQINVIDSFLLNSFETTTQDGTYKSQDVVRIDAVFEGNIQSTGRSPSMRILLNTGEAVTLNNVEGNKLSGNYIITSNADNVSRLRVTEVLSISDVQSIRSETPNNVNNINTYLSELENFINSNISVSINRSSSSSSTVAVLLSSAKNTQQETQIEEKETDEVSPSTGIAKSENNESKNFFETVFNPIGDIFSNVFGSIGDFFSGFF